MDTALKIAVVLTALDKMSTIIGNAVDKSKKKLSSLDKAREGFSRFGDKALIGGTAVTAFFAKSVEAAEESEIANNRLRQVFKSMGEANDEAANKAAAYANKLQMQIGIEDEVIMATQAKIATFKTVSNQTARMAGIFDRATKASFDMQATGFGEASGNAVQLGKALENPVKGINALTRSGITFTSSEQKKIKTLVETGNKLKAQEMILKAVEKQVGGVAEKTATKWQKAKIQAGEISESMGNMVLPMWNKFVDKLLNTVIPAIQKFVDEHPHLVKWLAIGGVALIGLGITAKVASFAIFGLTSTIKAARFVAIGARAAFLWLADSKKGLGHWVFVARYRYLQFTDYIKGTALPALKNFGNYIAGGFSKAWKMLTTGVTTGLAAIGRAATAMFSYIGTAIASVGRFMLANPIILVITAIATAALLIYKYWDKIKSFFQRLWNGVKSVFSSAWSGIKRMFLNYTPYGLVIKHWEKISGFFKNIWNKAKQPFIDFWSWMKGLGSQFWEAGKNIINSIWSGMKSIINKPVEAVKNMVGKIRKYLPFSPAKEGPLRDIHKIRLIETIAESIKPKSLIDRVRSVVGTVFNVMNRPGGAAAPAINGIGSRPGGDFHVTINLHGKATKEDAVTISKELEGKFKEWMKRYESHKSRVGFTT